MDLSKLIPFDTKRLTIDWFRQDDFSDFMAIEKSPEQHRFNSESFNPRTEQQIMSYISELSSVDPTSPSLPLRLAVRLRDTSGLVGFIGFKNGTLAAQGSVEVFYSIHHSYWNRGFGTEALAATIEFGFRCVGLHRIFAGCDIDNVASKTILEKVGMRFETRWRKDRLRNGRWTDGLGFAILEEDVDYPLGRTHPD